MNDRIKPDTEHLKQINALLEVALSLEADERDTWLRTLPREQQPFVPLLTSMLEKASVETDRFMCSPIALALEGLDEFDDDNEDRAGDTVGPYCLVGELGRGGMATVWLAERVDGLLHRHVALKLPHDGWTGGLVLRMAREREILATLEHPCIARLYDAGMTATGRPWMAMERIHGVAIDAYCRSANLGLEDRLRLFMQVIEAVAFAHARLVVHRDLKPSNILVTNEGQVRLLDFGVARLLGGAPEGRDAGTASPSRLTQSLDRAMTPDYASPEQIAGKALTVATDVYSLGIVLYELLVGERPYRLERQSAAALEEAILSAEIVPPSARAERVLAPKLRGDIDAILVKTLHKDPAHRYGSAEAHAADLQRHLDGIPVMAQVPSARYRTIKFIRRHRLGLATAAAIVLSLVAGLGTAGWQAREARTEAQRAAHVKDFVASILKQAAPRDGVGGVVTASELLGAASERIERELASDPRAAAELGVIVGEGFFSLGEAWKGQATLKAAVVRAEREWGPRHPITLQGKALLVESLGYADIRLAERLVNELVPDALAGLPQTAEPAVFALRGQAYVLACLDRHDASLAAVRRAIDIAEHHLGPQHRDTVRTLGLLTMIHGMFGEKAEQMQSSVVALDRARAAFAAARPHPTLAGAERQYGEALVANGRFDEAVPVLQRVVDDLRRLDMADTSRLKRAQNALEAALVASQGKLRSDAETGPPTGH